MLLSESKDEGGRKGHEDSHEEECEEKSHAHRHSQGYQAISTLRFTNRPMMKVRLGPTADRATSRWPSLTGQGRPTASGQEKQG